VRENKWRAARYGLDARVIVDREGTQVPVADHIRETMQNLETIAEELHCAREFAGLDAILASGGSSARQLLVADASGGDLREVVQHLIREFRAGPTLREHLAQLSA
jgi:carboxylate-amine ligase